MSNDLPDRLRVTARDFEPDTDRMWERVAAGMAEPDPVGARPTGRRPHVPQLVLATGAVVVLIGAMVFVGYVLNPAAEQVPAGPGTTSQAEETSAVVEPSEKPEPVDEVDYLTGAAQINGNVNDYWSQTEVTIRNDEPITELTLELHVVLGTDVEFTGQWVTAAHYFGEAEVFEEGGYLVFRWTLIEGQTVQPGEYILSGQFNHGDGPRETDGDYFVVEATAESGTSTVIGDVAPAD